VKIYDKQVFSLNGLNDLMNFPAITANRMTDGSADVMVNPQMRPEAIARMVLNTASAPRGNNATGVETKQSTFTPASLA